MNQHTSIGVTWRTPAGINWVTPARLVAILLMALIAATTASPVNGAAAGDDPRGTEPVPTLSGKGGNGQGLSMDDIRHKSKVDSLEKDGYTGQGIDVALIDSGVTPVQGLNGDDKLVYGPDLSNEASFEGLANLDTFGHGTHMAGIIAGNDGTGGEFLGMAPGSRIVSVKVAGATGETHVAQIIAAIDWVVEHRNDNGLNIRVLNLSFGLDDVPSNLNDPLSAAAERAWDAGIVVVAAAGNRGNDTDGVDSPAISPYVIAVGGATKADEKSSDVSSWSSAGNGERDPDVIAAGQSILSLRVPGSFIDQASPAAVVDDRYFKGTGTSQSTAVVSGAIAALLSADPGLTPDQVKYLLLEYAKDKGKGTRLDGEGLIRIKDVYRHLDRKDKAPTQTHPRATSGSDLQAPVGDSWSGGTWSGGTWSGGTWSGATWSGGTWSGGTWSGGTWSGATWSGATLTGSDWS